MTNDKYAHEMTFQELVSAGRDITDLNGRLIRRTDDPRQRWSAWQRDVQAASKRGLVPRDVMDWFQATKHLTRPPTAQDINILGTARLDSRFVVVNPDTPKFTWSPSKLSDFETCPYMFGAKHYYKTVPYEETVHTIWGTRVHREAELYMLGKDFEDVEAFNAVQPYVRLLSQLPGERLIEHKIALDDGWKPCEWQDGTARMIVDFAVKHENTIKAFDYKTGKVKEDDSQMKIYAYALAILHPDVEVFDFKYVWIKEQKITGFRMLRRELLPVAKDIRERVKRMKQAWDSENFPMRKNGLCRQWCGAKDCAYCGGGR